jgi:2-phosphosulfolactate phosphatase
LKIWSAQAPLSHLFPVRSHQTLSSRRAGFEYFRKTLPQTLRHCGSGKELIKRGFAADVELAAEFNVSSNVPCLRDRAFAGALAY